MKITHSFTVASALLFGILGGALIVGGLPAIGQTSTRENSETGRFQLMELSHRVSQSEPVQTSIEMKEIVKLDTATGRAWRWNESMQDKKLQSIWVELKDGVIDAGSRQAP